ncbi:MAG: sigma-54-dependent Fis family transcriptional regulator [Labilithrix sp.]|nr:sigma-54-dependent Fis family transcriptional regulator [Labilithrix sp.]
MGVLATPDKLGTILVVEDDAALRSGVAGALRRLGFGVIEADSCESATGIFAASRPDVVLTDLCLPDGDGLALLPRLHAIDAHVPVLMMTGYGSIDLAVRAVKQGAENFLTKPVDIGVLGAFVKDALERRRRIRSGTRRKFTGPRTFEPRSAAMQRVDAQVEKLRDADCTVLLFGETGTGKSMLARRIHAIGARRSGPFVDINCAGLTKDFVETELFGHERGAFTGAHGAKRGLLDVANGGTLFLDEIGDIDMQVQPKLLKVLEERRFRPMGDVRERSVDLRLIVATHHDLLQAVAQKTFRADLYYRVSTISVTMPSLRDRHEDIVPLAYHFLEDLGASDVELGPDARRVLLGHDWPGNLRELKNVLERALLLRSGDVVRAGDLHFDTPSGARLTPSSGPASSRTLSEVEREHIQSALAAEQGRVEAAARRLGIPRSTMYQRIKDYGIRLSKLRKTESGSDPPGTS